MLTRQRRACAQEARGHAPLRTVRQDPERRPLTLPYPYPYLYPYP